MAYVDGVTDQTSANASEFYQVDDNLPTPGLQPCPTSTEPVLDLPFGSARYHRRSRHVTASSFQQPRTHP